jgi:hypothetical protein
MSHLAFPTCIYAAASLPTTEYLRHPHTHSQIAQLIALMIDLNGRSRVPSQGLILNPSTWIWMIIQSKSIHEGIYGSNPWISMDSVSILGVWIRFTYIQSIQKGLRTPQSTGLIQSMDGWTNSEHWAEAAPIKKITPDEFKVWEVSTKAILKLHKPLGIIDGTDPDPTPYNPDSTVRAIPPALRARVAQETNDHERVKEGVIRCLPNSELLKLVDVQEDALAILGRLHDEYGCSWNLGYVKPRTTLSCSKRMRRC